MIKNILKNRKEIYKIMMEKNKDDLSHLPNFCYFGDFIDLKGNLSLKNFIKQTILRTAGQLIDNLSCAIVDFNNRDIKYIITPPLEEISSLIQKIQKTDLPITQCFFLYGSPGVGKTFVLDALLSMYHDFESEKIDVVEALNLKTIKLDLGNQNLRHSQHSESNNSKIIIIDEIDKELNESNVSFFLKTLDKLRKDSLKAASKTKTIIIITSNKTPEELPKPLVRAGRITKFIKVLPWGEKEAKDFSATFGIPFDRLTKDNDGFWYAGQLFEDAQKYILETL